MIDKLKFCLLATMLTFVLFVAIAQEKIKFGEISAEDLTMSVYPNDTAAVAVVLYEDCNVRFDVGGEDFILVTNHTVRVKILKSAGLDKADIAIPFYFAGGKTNSESVRAITGYTYNMVDGKIERIKLSKTNIFEEETSPNWRRIKIAVPNVKVGSIFEVKYEQQSPYYYNIDDFAFQSSIPVKYCRYQITIPEYFTFRKRLSGYEHVDYAEEPVGVTLLFDASNRISCRGQQMTFTASDLPALKSDSYVWNRSDYISKVTFDLVNVGIPGVYYKDFSTTWQEIDKQLGESERFGKQLRVSNLMKTELPAVLKDSMTSYQKVAAILDLVKEKIQWNDKNAFYVESVRKAVKDGVGSSAEMNALLINLLSDAGFEAYPVVLSLRSSGRLFSSYPSIKALNYFIVGVFIDGKPAYMDASHKYGTVNVLPTDCMVQEARSLFKDNIGQWVDLHAIGRSSTMIAIKAGFNDDGSLSGTVQTFRTGIPYATYCRDVDKQKSIEEYQESLEDKLKVSVSNIDQGKPKDMRIEENYAFENNEIALGDEYIYINSLIFPHIKENPFKAETRKMPVEYSYPYDHVMSVTLTLPEGYELEEIPKAEKINLGDNQITYNYAIQKNGRNVQIIQRMSVKETLYPVDQYQHLRDFWAHIANKNNTQLVLKRVTQSVATN